MSWVKLDDRLWSHPKVRRAWKRSRGSMGLYLLALTYSAQHETDGLLDSEWIEDMLPAKKERDQALNALVSAGLFDEEEGGFRIHDYLDHNESRAEAEARRERDRERKARGGRGGRPRDSTGTPDGFHADSVGNPSGLRVDSGSTRAPVPSRPVPSIENNPPTPQGGSAVKFDRKVVPADVLETATSILDDFNRQAGTGYGAFTGSGQPSEALKRILGALRDHPSLDAPKAARIVTLALGRPFWEGKPQPGVVFGPGVVAKHLEDVSVAPSLSVVERVARLNAAGEAA